MLPNLTGECQKRPSPFPTNTSREEEVRKRTANNRLCPHAGKFTVAKISLVRSQSICTAPGCTWSYQLHSPPVRAGISPTLARCRNARTHETAGEARDCLLPSLVTARAKVSVCRSRLQLHCALIHLSMEEVERLAGLPLIQIQNPRLSLAWEGLALGVPHVLSAGVGSVALWGRRTGTSETHYPGRKDEDHTCEESRQEEEEEEEELCTKKHRRLIRKVSRGAL